MSERSFDGLAQIEQITGLGMISVRGTLADAEFQAVIKSATSIAIPERGYVAQGTGRTLAWMSPDEVLLVCDGAEIQGIIAALNSSLKGSHHMVTDVSDARAVFSVSGDASRDVLSKLCPVDLRPGAFKAGQFRRSRLAQVACAFWAVDDTTFHVIGFRSVQDYFWNVLTTVADAEAAVNFHAS